MKCQDLMRRPLEVVAPGETIAVAARKMRKSNIGFLAVCDSSGRVHGVVTDRDLAVRAVANDLSPSRTRVADVMSRDVVSCRTSADVADAQRMMQQHKKSRILVIAEDRRPVGVISLSDFAARRDPKAADILRDVAEREVVRGDGAAPAKPEPQTAWGPER